MNKKWKDALLKTSLPLEHLVAEKFTNRQSAIQGEYHYLRPNEQGIWTEFSVDLWAVDHMSRKETGLWANLNYLIECKYCYPGIKWLFAPHTNTAVQSSFEIGIIHALDHLLTKQIFNKRPLWRLSNRFPICHKGIELHANDATAQNIERGRSQLRYGLPNLAIHLSEVQKMNVHDEDMLVEFTCPLLVTTADLFVINHGVNLDNFKNAENCTDIARPVNALVLTNPYSHLYSSYIDKMTSNFHQKNPGIKVRLKQLDSAIKKISGKDENSHIPGSFSFDWEIREASERILVTNYDFFDDIRRTLKRTVIKAGRTLTQVGVLNRNASDGKTWISEV